MLNERFGTQFTQADELFFEQVKTQATEDPAVVQRARVNPFDNFALSLRKHITDLMLDRIDQNAKIVAKYVNEQEFQDVVFNELARRIYEEPH